MAEPLRASSRPSASRRHPLSSLHAAVRVRQAAGVAATRLAEVDRRVVLAAVAVSLTILAAAMGTGLQQAGAALIAAIWIRVGADAVTPEPQAPMLGRDDPG